MKNKILFLLGIALIFLNFSVYAQLFGLPKPSSTNLTEKTSQEISGQNFTVYQYKSTLSQGEILSFYREKLPRQGWSKMNLQMPNLGSSYGGTMERVFNYTKDDQMLVLNFSPYKVEGMNFYSISIGDFPKIGQSQPLDMFKEPQKQNFMPIYPGAKQVDYRDIASGVQAGYMASGGIEAVAGFYKQKMPQYGWSLADQSDIASSEYDMSKIQTSCVTCPKVPEIPAEAQEMVKNTKMEGTTLEFKQGQKTCMINITEMGNTGMDLTSYGLGDTIITVFYHDKK